MKKFTFSGKIWIFQQRIDNIFPLPKYTRNSTRYKIPLDLNTSHNLPSEYTRLAEVHQIRHHCLYNIYHASINIIEFMFTQIDYDE